MPSNHDPKHPLYELTDVVAPLHVRPLVNEHAIEIQGIELAHQRRCDRDFRFATRKHAGESHAIGQHDARGTPASAHTGPVLQACQQLMWALTPVAFRGLHGVAPRAKRSSSMPAHTIHRPMMTVDDAPHAVGTVRRGAPARDRRAASPRTPPGTVE
jgi:hypothetical protein